VHRDQALVPNGQASVARKPRERALHPPAVTPQSMPRLNLLPGDPMLDAAGDTGVTAARIAIALVSMDLGGATARAAASTGTHGCHRVEQRREHPTVVDVRRRHGGE